MYIESLKEGIKEMIEEIDIKELKAVLLESIEKRKQERAYNHPLLLYVNYIEAMVKCGARHRDIASFFNSKLGLSGKNAFTNQKLVNARQYWRKIKIIDIKEVDNIVNQLKNSQSNTFNIEVNELKDFMKEIYNITKQPVSNTEHVKQFYLNNKNNGLSLSALANKYLQGK